MNTNLKTKDNVIVAIDNRMGQEKEHTIAMHVL